MYAVIALGIVVTFATAAVLVPSYCRVWQKRILERLRKLLLCNVDRAVLDTGGRRDRELTLCFRLWFFTGAAVFAVLGFLDGQVIRNQPGSIGSAVGYGFLAMGASSLFVLSVMAYTWFLPGVKLYTAMTRCGFRELWITALQAPSTDLREGLAARVGNSTRVPIVDVTGFELLGKGAGPGGGLIFDALAATPQVPVSLLLLEPHANQLDPDHRRATVFQTVLSEMRIASATYMKRIRATLEAVRVLNEGRTPEGQIQVRFYSEKPTFRAMIFEDSMVVSPSLPRENESRTFIDLARSSPAPSFYESFRHHFSRLWKSSVTRVNLGEAPKAPNAPKAPEARRIADPLAARS